MVIDNAVAIIPARGGSKRLPRKNIAPLGGKPLMAHTIDAARNSGCFSEIIVSTEDEEIARVARTSGATVIERKQALASDTATVVEVCCDVLATLQVRGVARPAHFACLLATAALRRAEDIREASAKLEDGRCDFVMAVTEYSKSPLQALASTGDGSLQLMWPDLADIPRKDAPHLLVDNGSIYWCRTAAFLEQKSFYGRGLAGYWMPPERSIDVDTAHDLELLTYYFSRRGSAPEETHARP